MKKSRVALLTSQSTSQPTTADILRFRGFIHWWFHHYGRHDLPWRQAPTPYQVLVSELMLQQTQVARVIPKYVAFLQRFPTAPALAQAELAQVVMAWQGLGYNRRAKYIWQTAQVVTKRWQGVFPTNFDLLLQLPGIGAYTAAAVLVFAYNQPAVLIETNIRAVLLYHFFPQQSSVADRQLLPILESCLVSLDGTSRDWYAALMDYGSYLKSILPNPSRRSQHHVKQSRFEGSLRQVRGALIRYLSQAVNQQAPLADLQQFVLGNPSHLTRALAQLQREGLVTVTGEMIKLGTK